jgi:hypothetical protein
MVRIAEAPYQPSSRTVRQIANREPAPVEGPGGYWTQARGRTAAAEKRRGQAPGLHNFSDHTNRGGFVARSKREEVPTTSEP